VDAVTYDIRILQALPVAADRLWPRPGGFLCLACIPGGAHGLECWGRSCPCRCRAVLHGPFGGLGDPTVPGYFEQELTIAADQDADNPAELEGVA
jgi:hypothetical protein